MTVNKETSEDQPLFGKIKIAIIQLDDEEPQENEEQQEDTANDKFEGITTAPVKNLLTGKWEDMDIEAMDDGTVIQSTCGVMCFKVKALLSDENYWVGRNGNIRSNIELAQRIREQFKDRRNLYVAVSPDVIKKIS